MGLNGSGKTSLLKILHASFTNESAGLAKVRSSSQKCIFSAKTTMQASSVRSMTESESIDEDSDQAIQMEDGSWEIVHMNSGPR